LSKIVFWSAHRAETINVLGKENIKSLYRVDVINVGLRGEKKFDKGSCSFYLFFLQIQSLWIDRNYYMMLCFINVTKFCSGSAVRCKDNIQDVLNKEEKFTVLCFPNTEILQYSWKGSRMVLTAGPSKSLVSTL
jgi:hypothetical protein